MAVLQSNQINLAITIAVGLGVVVASAILYHFYFSDKKRTKAKDAKKLVLLQDPQAKYTIPLVEKEEVSHDTRRFRFGLPTKNHVLGLPIGQHINVLGKVDDDLVIRSYTPVSSDDDFGYVDLVVKVYFKNVHPRFPAGGKMSQHLESLKLGDTITIRGPAGRLVYQGDGKFSIKKLRNEPAQIVKASKVNMIAGGTGITPMLQLIRHILKTRGDETQLRLLFANQTEKDILVRKELEEAANNYPEQFKLWYTLDTPPADWKYSTGFINEAMIKEHLFPPGPDTLVLMCGPPPMINFACIPNLDKLGYNKDSYFAY